MGFAALGASLLSALANATLRIPNALRHANIFTHSSFSPQKTKHTYKYV